MGGALRFEDIWKPPVLSSCLALSKRHQSEAEFGPKFYFRLSSLSWEKQMELFLALQILRSRSGPAVLKLEHACESPGGP